MAALGASLVSGKERFRAYSAEVEEGLHWVVRGLCIQVRNQVEVVVEGVGSLRVFGVGS